eukprot:g6355.t1
MLRRNKKKKQVAPPPKKVIEAQTVTPGLLNTKNVPIALAAKARWADLKSHVSKDVDTKGKIKNIKVKYRVTDVWQQMMDNEANEGEDSVLEENRKGIRLNIHLYDTNFPPSSSKYITKWSRPPQLTFIQNIGDGTQDFRWLGMLATKRFRAGYRPHGRLRQREYGAGSRAQFVPKRIFLEKIGARDGFKKETTQVIVDISILKDHLKDGDDVYVHFREGVPLGLFAGNENAKIQVPLYVSSNHKSEKNKEKVKRYQAFVKMKKKKSLSRSPFPEIALADNSHDSSNLVDDQHMKEKEKKTVADTNGKNNIDEMEKKLDLPTSVFSERANLSDSKGFFDTDEFYERVCEADFHYCPRVRRMVEDNPDDYEKIKAIVADSYRYVREAFRYHVAESASDSFEMSWMDFTTFAKHCKIVDPSEEEHGGFTFTDLDSIWILVNCHENNDMVKSHHIRYLSRFEFLEAIIRIAVAKYGTNDAGQPRLVSSAVDTLIEANIKQHYKTMDANTFRRLKLYHPRTNKVIADNERSIRLAFKTYAKFQSRKDKYTRKHTIKNGGIAFADDPNCLTKIQFVELLHAGGVFEDRRRLKKDAFRVFIYSQNTTLDEFQRSKDSSLRDDSKTLCYPEFLEALARLSEINHLTEKSGGMGNVSTPSGRSVSSQSFAKTFEEFILGIVNKLNL